MELGQLAAALVAGDRRALAKAVTIVEDDRPGRGELLAAVAPDRRGVPIVGITGPPGAGKSTLVSALVDEVRSAGRSVAVLAVDPSSPRSGGAILGDRVRMLAHSGDPDVFVRSAAARGRAGGLAWQTVPVVDLLDAAGFDVVVIETVGAGQSEVDVAAIADLTVVVVAPGAGDDVQAMKAGILEVADVLVVNKADLPGAEQARRDLEAMTSLAPGDPVPVLTTVAITGEGIAALAALVPDVGSEAALTRRAVAAIRAAVERRLRDALMDRAGLDRLAGFVIGGELTVDEAAGRWLDGEEREGG